MKEFFKNMLTAGSRVSSKRFISLFSLFLFTVVVVVSFFIPVQDAIIYSLLSLISSQSLFTLFQGNKTNNTVEKPNSELS